MAETKRLRKTVDPCPRCALHRSRCICEHIPQLDLRTRLSLVIHYKELKRTTNTGRRAVHALKNSTLRIRGEGREALNLSDLILPDYENVVLFPSEDAIEIESFHSEKPIHFIVSDGNWRQAAKLNIRHKELKTLPRVKVSRESLDEHRLRLEHFANGMATLEAIALAFRAVEGDGIGNQLMALYRAKLKATLEGRGVPS